MKYKKKTIGLILTYACNLNCLYCYEENKQHGKVMSIQTAKCIIEESFCNNQDNCEELEFDFLGGEPLLEFNLMKEIAEWMWSKNWPKPYILFATTNGTNLTELSKTWFSINKHRIVLGLSYDGNEAMQNINRSNSSNQIDINYFVKTWPDQPVKMTVSSKTLPNLSNGIRYLHSIGFNKINANLAYATNWNKEDIYKYKSQLADLVDFYFNNPQVLPSSLFNIDITQVLSPKKVSKYCGSGSGLTYFDVDGMQYPCQWFTPLVLDKKELDEIAKIDFQNEICFLNKKCEKCRLSNVCSTCYGMNFKVFGDLKQRPSWYCNAFIEQFLANCRLQIKIINRKILPLSLEDKIKVYTLKKINKSLIFRSTDYVDIR